MVEVRLRRTTTGFAPLFLDSAETNRNQRIIVGEKQKTYRKKSDDHGVSPTPLKNSLASYDIERLMLRLERKNVEERFTRKRFLFSQLGCNIGYSKIVDREKTIEYMIKR